MKQYFIIARFLLIWILLTTTLQLQVSAQRGVFMNLDSSHVILLLKKSTSLADPDSIRYTLESALGLSRQINYENGVLESLSQLSKFEKAEKNTSIALRYALQALTRMEKKADHDNLFNIYLQIGNIYQSERLYLKAKEYYQQALSVLDKNVDPDKEIKLYALLGTTYFNLEIPDSALINFERLITLYNAQNHTNGLIGTYRQIVEVFNKQKDYKRALEYNLKIRDLVQEINNPRLDAIISNNIAYNYNHLNNYQKAIDIFEYLVKVCEKTPYLDLSILYTNLAIAHSNLGNLDNAVKSLIKARKNLNTQADDKKKKTYIDNLIASIYLKNDDIYSALKYNELAMETASQHNFDLLLSEIYNIGAQIQEALYDHEKALHYYKKHLELRDSFRLEERGRQQELLQQQFLHERTEKEIRLLGVQKEIQDLTISQLQLQKVKTDLELKAKEDEIVLYKRDQEIKEANLKNTILEAERAKQELELTNQKLTAAQKEKALADLKRDQQIALAQKAIEEEKSRNQIDSLNRSFELLEQQKKLDNERQKNEREKEKAFRRSIFGLVALLTLILLLILAGLFSFRAANRKLALKNEQIENQKRELEKSRDEIQNERAKAEELLLNILPAETAHELKEKGGATPRNYQKVTVLFTDFSGFTKIAQSMSPQQLIQELNTCFLAFDEIIDKHKLEKIKTIGDAYMCAGGIPIPNDTNPVDAVAAALEMAKYIDKRNKDKEAKGEAYWQMRIGIHTGQVIAGVVGKKKFAYDIWGDTVNLASRLESNGSDGKINISGVTFEHVKHDFECSYRGEVNVKDSGKVDMFFVEGSKIGSKT